ncbi:SDR family NAD(P)-dependent oxidoreductase [archaeon]|nr:MAG: SDR family NAD(P)-dependent oxidoreductase [archaeon]
MMWIVLAVAAAIAAIMCISDADLGLWLAPNPPDKAFRNQVIWIVGASSGIGAALGLEYCKSHSKVVFSARRVEQLHDLAKQCSALGAEGFVLPLDVTDYDAHQAAVDTVLQKYGQIDTLVLNAGKSQRNLAVETPFEVTRDIMELNFFSLVALNKLVLPHMVQRNSGAIMVMSSVSGVLGTPVASSYSASKFALHGYFNALR